MNSVHTIALLTRIKKQVFFEPFDMFINPCVTGAVVSNNRWFVNELPMVIVKNLRLVTGEMSTT